MSGAQAAADAARIDALLPQTQCTRCGYAGCLPYAAAIACGEANINQCPPGGYATVQKLALLLDRDPLPLNPDNGVESEPLLAVIDEARCIGCAKCLPPCPTDAILGTQRMLHTVIAENCTGCELCVAPCPVDCIRMVPRATLLWAQAAPSPSDNAQRYRAHNARWVARTAERAALLKTRKSAAAQRGPA